MFITEAIISIFAPHHCLGCGEEGLLLCGACQQSEVIPLPSRCFLCKALTTDYRVCDSCKRKTPLRHVFVATEYQDLPQSLIHKLKFERAQAAAWPAAQLMQEVLPYLPGTLIVPVPTASSRVRLRGYDQAKLMAKLLSRLCLLESDSVLVRSGQSRQVGASRDQRLKQLQGAFYVKNAGKVKGRHILLVDDIVTTGATLSSAAWALKLAGAKKVDAAVLAQRS